MSVIGEISCGEHYEAVEQRYDPRTTTYHVAVPQLQMTSYSSCQLAQVEQEVELVVGRARFVCKARGCQPSRELGGAFPGREGELVGAFTNDEAPRGRPEDASGLRPQ